MGTSSEFARAALDLSQPVTNIPTTNDTTPTPFTSSSLKRLRKVNYQKLNTEEDLALVRLCVEHKSLFRHGSKTIFWNKMQTELSRMFNKKFSSVDRHVTGMVRKYRAGRLKMPQEYILCLEKWYRWQENHCGAGDFENPNEPSGIDAAAEEIDEHIVDPDMAPSARKRQRRTKGGEEHLSYNGISADHSPTRPEAPDVNGTRKAREKDLAKVVIKTNLRHPAGENAPVDVIDAGIDGGPDGGDWPDSSASGGGDPIRDQLDRAVETLTSQLRKSSPGIAANSALLLAVIGLVRDNRNRIFDLDDDIRKEQKKRKWNDDIVWSMVKNKCAELDLDYNDRLRRALPTDHDLGNSPIIKDIQKTLTRFTLTTEAYNATFDRVENELARLVSEGKEALHENQQQKRLENNHTACDIHSQEKKGNTSYVDDHRVTCHGALQEELRMLVQKTNADAQKIILQESLISTMDQRLHELEGRLAKAISTKG